MMKRKKLRWLPGFLVWASMSLEKPFTETRNTRGDVGLLSGEFRCLGDMATETPWKCPIDDWLHISGAGKYLIWSDQHIVGGIWKQGTYFTFCRLEMYFLRYSHKISGPVVLNQDDFALREYLAISGDFFGYRNWWEGLLASGRKGPKMLLNISQYIGQPL